MPVACFFLPKRIINDIWVASSPPDRPRRTDVPLTSWWLLFAAAQLAHPPLPGPTADRDGRSRAVHRHRSAVYRCGAAACRDESAPRRLSLALCPIRHGQ